tara:strand:- start:44 stop:310 length:267 start_codon:yes stop_codon:yes gene_type:complete
MKKNQLKAFINEVEKAPDLKQKLESGDMGFLQVANEAGFNITKKDAKGFLFEINRITNEDKTNMPPLVVLIMAYLNILFPEYKNTSKI